MTAATGRRQARRQALFLLFQWDLTGQPLLSLYEMLARVDEVTLDEIAALTDELYDPAGLSAAAIGTSEERFRAALPKVSEELAAAA